MGNLWATPQGAGLRGTTALAAEPRWPQHTTLVSGHLQGTLTAPHSSWNQDWAALCYSRRYYPHSGPAGLKVCREQDDHMLPLSPEPSARGCPQTSPGMPGSAVASDKSQVDRSCFLEGP